MEFVRVKGTPCHHSTGKRMDGAPQSFELNTDLIAAYMGNKVYLKAGGGIIKLGTMHYNNITLDPVSNTQVI